MYFVENPLISSKIHTFCDSQNCADFHNIGLYFFKRMDMLILGAFFGPRPGPGDAAVRRAVVAPGMLPIDPQAL